MQQLRASRSHLDLRIQQVQVGLQRALPQLVHKVAEHGLSLATLQGGVGAAALPVWRWDGVGCFFSQSFTLFYTLYRVCVCVEVGVGKACGGWWSQGQKAEAEQRRWQGMLPRSILCTRCCCAVQTAGRAAARDRRRAEAGGRHWHYNRTARSHLCVTLHSVGVVAPARVRPQMQLLQQRLEVCHRVCVGRLQGARSSTKARGSAQAGEAGPAGCGAAGASRSPASTRAQLQACGHWLGCPAVTLHSPAPPHAAMCLLRIAFALHPCTLHFCHERRESLLTCCRRASAARRSASALRSSCRCLASRSACCSSALASSAT